MLNLIWSAVTQTMLQSSCGRYQVSRSPDGKERFLYRAWHRPDNTIITTVQCFNESGDRAAATEECKAACLAHSLEE